MSERRSAGGGRRGSGDGEASSRSLGDDRRGGRTSVTGGNNVGFSSIGHRGSSSSVSGRGVGGRSSNIGSRSAIGGRSATGDGSERSFSTHVGTRVASGEGRTGVGRGAGPIGSSDERRLGIGRGVNAGEGSQGASGGGAGRGATIGRGIARGISGERRSGNGSGFYVGEGSGGASVGVGGGFGRGANSGGGSGGMSIAIGRGASGSPSGGASDRRSGGSNVAGSNVGGSNVAGSNVGGRSGTIDEDYHLSDDSYYDSSSDEDTEERDYYDDVVNDCIGSNSGGGGGSYSGGPGGSDGAGGSGNGHGEAEYGDRYGSEGEEEVEEEAEHARRGYSVGIYGHPPQRPHRILMLGRVIDSPTACRTLLALMRIHWPAGCIGAKDIDKRFPRWWRFIRDEFFRYFQFDPRHGTLEDAREAVRHHMRNNLRKTLCNERIRVQKIIDEKGGDFIDYKPAYLSDDVWEAFCNHWASPEFRRRSQAAGLARGHQNNPHTSGAISFQRRAWDICDKEGEEPARYDLYIRMHTKKDNNQLTSQAVRDVVDKYLALCNAQNKDPNQASIDTWAEAVGVRRNSIVGVPRMRASDLIPLPPTATRRRRRRVDDEGRAIIDYMVDDLVMQAVERTVAYASAHPEQFNLGPQQVRTLAESVVDGVSDLPEDHPLSMRTMRELVQVMVSVLVDVNARPRPASKDNGKMHAREDYQSSSDSDDEPRAPPSPPAGRRATGIHIRGD